MTSGKLAKLIADTQKARALIVDLFQKAVVNIPDQYKGWGQWLDDPKSLQYGIYGSSAGVQILHLGGIDKDHEVMKGAMAFIEKGCLEPKGKIFDKGDITVNFKLAFIVDATRVFEREIDSECQTMQKLVDRQLPGEGWGNYVEGDNNDTSSRVPVTAYVLWALRRYRRFIGMSSSDEAVSWLASQVINNDDLDLSEVGLAGIALGEYSRSRANDYNRSREKCVERLIEFSKHSSPSQFGISKFMNYYTTSVGGNPGNRYVFFLPHCLAALALMKLGSAASARKYISDVVRFFSQEVNSKKGFGPPNSGRLSTVDHLWIYRLFLEFESTAAQLVSGFSLKVVGLKPWQRHTLTAALFLMALPATYIAYAQRTLEEGSLVVVIIAGALAALLLSLCARCVWEFYFKGE